MRNRNFALVAFALLAVVSACAESPVEKPAAPERLPARAVKGAAFEVTILPTPEARGPGMGRPSYPTLWKEIAEGTDGNPATNPARTIQIRSVANFVGVPGALPPGCGSDQYIDANVRITNFYPERFVDPYVVITNSITGNGLCAGLGAQPVETPYNGESFSGLPNQAGAFGFIPYVTFNLEPRQSLAASIVETGASGGTPREVAWRFNYPTTQTVPFTIRGQVWGFPMPNPPNPSGNSWGGYVGRNENLAWNVIDIADDLSQPRVTSNSTVVCSVAPGADGSCAGTTYFSGEVTGSNGLGYKAMQLNLAGVGSLNAGDLVYIRAINRWNNGTNIVTGSFPYVEQVRITGPGTPNAPASGATVASDTVFSWTVQFPDPARVQNGTFVFAICPTNVTCTGFDFGGSSIFMLNTRPGFIATNNGDGSYTFTTPPFSDAFFDPVRAAPGNYQWNVQSALFGRQGGWGTPRPFVVP